MDDGKDINSLLQSCARNDSRAQEQLYKRCYPYGITVALYYSSSQEEAEEILQDSFVKLFRALAAGKQPKVLKPWFRKMVINTAIDHYRKPRQGWKVFKLLPRPVVRNEAVALLNDEDFYRLLQQLPTAYRLVFSLHVLEGLPHAEIAEQLGISVGTSKSNLYKARRKLQKLAAPFFLLDIKLSNA